MASLQKDQITAVPSLTHSKLSLSLFALNELYDTNQVPYKDVNESETAKKPKDAEDLSGSSKLQSENREQTPP